MQANLRNVKLINGYNTIKLKAEQGITQWLCEMCSKQDSCKIRRAFVSVYDKVKTPIRSCNEFEPLISFVPPHKGFDRYFNTVRMHSAWARRVYEGQTVGFYCVKNQEIFGTGVIERVLVCDMQEVKNVHCRFSHLWGDDKVTCDDVADLFERKLKNMYGSGFIKNAKDFSVLYIRPK